MNNNPGQEVLIYGEEHTRIGGTQVSKQTVIHATDDHFVAIQVEQASTPLLSPVQASPHHAIQDSSPTASEFSCLECCFRCDSDHQWYDLEGKGFCLVLLLLLGYLVFGVIVLALWLVCCVLGCICQSNDD